VYENEYGFVPPVVVFVNATDWPALIVPDAGRIEMVSGAVVEMALTVTVTEPWPAPSMLSLLQLPEPSSSTPSLFWLPLELPLFQLLCRL
jgi:hypothetical protein